MVAASYTCHNVMHLEEPQRQQTYRSFMWMNCLWLLGWFYPSSDGIVVVKNRKYCQILPFFCTVPTITSLWRGQKQFLGQRSRGAIERYQMHQHNSTIIVWSFIKIAIIIAGEIIRLNETNIYFCLYGRLKTRNVKA